MRLKIITAAMAANIVLALGTILSSVALFAPPVFGAMAPNPSKFCASLLLARNAIDSATLPPSRYTLNSLEAFAAFLGANDSSVPTLKSGIALRSPDEKYVQGNLSREALIGQLKGIQVFAAQTEGSAANQQQRTEASTLVGHANIDAFLSDLRQAAENRGPYEKLMELVGRLSPVTFFAAGALLYATGFDDFMFNIASISMTGPAIFIGKSLQRVRTSLIGFASTMAKLGKISSDPRVGGWAILSYNARMHADLLNTLNAGYVNPIIDLNLADQVELDLGMADRAETKSAQWVGVDLVLDHRGETPELHIVIRQTKDRPVFPKTQSRKDEARGWNLDLGAPLQPATIPVRK